MYKNKEFNMSSTPAAKWRENGEADPHGHTDHYDGERSRLCKGDLTDDQLANEVYLNPGIANITAAKERIRWLSRALEKAKATSSLAEIMTEYDAAKDDDGWDEGHPIFQMAEHIDQMKSVLVEAQRLMQNGANGSITDTVWSDTRPNTTLYELMHEFTGVTA